MDTHGKQRRGFFGAYRSGARPESDAAAAKASKPVLSRNWVLRKSKTHHEKEQAGRGDTPVAVVNLVESRKSVSHVETNLSSVASFLQVKVLATDMPGYMQVHAFKCARRTYDSLEKFSTKHMAHNIKKEFDRVYGPAWHCIVGSSFGSFVTHSTGCFLYFSMENIFVLVFKTKVQRAK
ncbi:uncharacterized protein LOC122076207 [Macadamia integrifolia]|uniref:uncharacterized protein LOC122076207 n=1 Tax=Macadamia integrifolia TaxID=60698 RepID=UPI001C4E2FEA|nr:uncharacterized protein LOC122076207 [Macadamia integrifolia]